jgi:hypothetical protein
MQGVEHQSVNTGSITFEQMVASLITFGIGPHVHLMVAKLFLLKVPIGVLIGFLMENMVTNHGRLLDQD